MVEEKRLSLVAVARVTIRVASGQPVSLLRLGYPEAEAVAFIDDDFMYYNNVTTEFQEFMEGPYSIVLKYTGLRWLGKS